MNFLLRCILVAFVATASRSFGAEAGTTAIKASFVVKVNDRNSATATLINAAEEAHGYFSQLGDGFVIIKVPDSAVESCLALCGRLGVVVDRSFEATDQSQAIAGKEIRIKARRDLLKDHFDMLQQSTAGSVLTVEKAVSELTAEIESLEADVRVMRHSLDFAEIRVDFRFRERRAPLKSATSLFGWLNRLNLIDLREEFENGM